MHKEQNAARLAATAIILLIMVGGIAFSYYSKVPTSNHTVVSRHAQGQLAGLSTRDTPQPSDSNESSSTTSTENENSTGTTSQSETESNSSSTTTGESSSENETTTTTGTQSENETQSSTTTETDTENETSTITSSSENETSSVTTTSSETDNETETETSVTSSVSENETQTSTTGNETQPQFDLVPLNLSSLTLPPGYQVGNGTAEVDTEDGQLTIQLDLSGMNNSTTFSLGAVINGSVHVIGSFTSNSDGEAEFEAALALAAGTYQVGLVVNDTSTVSSPFAVLVSSPATETFTIGGSSSETTSTETATTQSGGENEASSISAAIGSSEIPVIIGVTGTGVNFVINDHNFTVFVGQLSSDGLQISISANGVSSPRVLLINLTSTQLLRLENGSLVILFDGSRVHEATSLSQVLNVKATDSPSFIIVTTASGSQLLISIPHFSTHLIQLFPAIAQTLSNVFRIDGLALVLSLVAVTTLFVAIFSRRVRYSR